MGTRSDSFFFYINTLETSGLIPPSPPASQRPVASRTTARTGGSIRQPRQDFPNIDATGTPHLPARHHSRGKGFAAPRSCHSDTPHFTAKGLKCRKNKVILGRRGTVAPLPPKTWGGNGTPLSCRQTRVAVQPCVHRKRRRRGSCQPGRTPRLSHVLVQSPFADQR